VGEQSALAAAGHNSRTDVAWYTVLWKCALLGEQAKWKHQSKWIWEKAKNVCTCIGMDHLRSSSRVLINQTDEMGLETIAM
jgi:hypothetical protein